MKKGERRRRRERERREKSIKEVKLSSLALYACIVVVAGAVKFSARQGSCHERARENHGGVI